MLCLGCATIFVFAPKKGVEEISKCQNIGLLSTVFLAQHLSSQNYQICIRRESQYCSICFEPNISLTIEQPSILKQVSITTLKCIKNGNMIRITCYPGTFHFPKVKSGGL